MRDDDTVPVTGPVTGPEELAGSEDTARILKRRRELQARSLGRWRKLLVAGVATGAAFGALTCRAQVCLSQAIGLECSVDGPSLPLEHVVQIDAYWVDSSPEPFQVFLSAQIGQYSNLDEPLVFSGSPQLVDATIMNTTSTDPLMTISCDPAPGATSIEVVLPLDCNGYSEVVHLLLDISEPPVDGHDIPFTWLD